jgi:hypothetical protein
VKHFSNRGCENGCCNDGMTPPALTDPAPQATSCAPAAAAGGRLALARRCKTFGACPDGRIAPPKGGSSSGARPSCGAKTLHFVPKCRWRVERNRGTVGGGADSRGPKNVTIRPEIRLGAPVAAGPLERRAPVLPAGAARDVDSLQKAPARTEMARSYPGRALQNVHNSADSRFRTGPALGTSLDPLDARVAGGAQISPASPEKLCVFVRKLRKVALSSGATAGFGQRMERMDASLARSWAASPSVPPPQRPDVPVYGARVPTYW